MNEFLFLFLFHLKNLRIMMKLKRLDFRLKIMKLLTDGWWAIISIPIEFTFTFSCCYIAFSFVVTMWIIFTNKFWKYKIRFLILKIRAHSSIELKFDNLLEWYIYMKNKVPEQSSLEVQPGLHKHQLSWSSL